MRACSNRIYLSPHANRRLVLQESIKTSFAKRVKTNRGLRGRSLDLGDLQPGKPLRGSQFMDDRAGIVSGIEQGDFAGVAPVVHVFLRKREAERLEAATDHVDPQFFVGDDVFL
jgi:hypothetical protein